MGEAKLETGKLGEECLPRGPILWRESERPELGAAGVKFESDFVQGRGWSRDPDHPATNIFSRVRVGQQDSLIGFQFHGRFQQTAVRIYSRGERLHSYGSSIQKSCPDKYRDLERDSLASTSFLGIGFGHTPDLLRCAPGFL